HGPSDDIIACEGEQLEHSIFHLGDSDRVPIDADQALHLVDRQAAAAQGIGHLAAGRLQAGEQARGGFLAVLGRHAAGRTEDRLLDIRDQPVRVFDQLGAFFEAAARAVEHRFDLDEAGGDGGFGHSWLRAPYWPGWAEATLVWVLAAVRIWTVVGPLSTSLVSGSHTWLRMPIWAELRPAMSSRLVSPAVRGAGPPNRASIACCCASAGVIPPVPATGGARLKSGGMISGALRATWNSSGLLGLPLRAAQP